MSRRLSALKRSIKKNLNAGTFRKLIHPIIGPLASAPPLESRGNRPLQMTFDDQLNILIYFHLEEHTSGRHLLQALEQESFASDQVAPKFGIKKSSFFEALGNRGLEQLLHVYEGLQAQARQVLPAAQSHLGELIAIDGSRIDSVLSMDWATYQEGSNKAKIHIGFDLNRGIPKRVFLTDANTDERPFVSRILDSGQTGVLDRGYQQYCQFDHWQAEGKHFVCRIKTNSQKTILEEHEVSLGSAVFFDATVLLGIAGVNQTKQAVRLVGYRVDSKDYWIATDRHDLTAQEVADVYRLRWNIETFFGWWKQHLKVYPLIARSKHGLMVQILGGLITYLLLAIYCYKEYRERVSIQRVRELRFKIRNEAAARPPLSSKRSRSSRIRRRTGPAKT